MCCYGVYRKFWVDAHYLESKASLYAISMPCTDLKLAKRVPGPPNLLQVVRKKIRNESNKHWQAVFHETTKPDRYTCRDSLFSRAMNIHLNILGISFTHSSSIQPRVLLRVRVFWLTEVRQTALWEFCLWNEVGGTSTLNKYSPPKITALSKVCCLLNSCLCDFNNQKHFKQANLNISYFILIRWCWTIMNNKQNWFPWSNLLLRIKVGCCSTPNQQHQAVEFTMQHSFHSLETDLKLWKLLFRCSCAFTQISLSSCTH